MGKDGEEGGMTEYEKQRLARIRENKARLEDLRLHGLAASLRADISKQQEKSASSVPSKRKQKTSGDDEEEEYRLSDEDEVEEDEDSADSCRSSEEIPPPSSARKKGKGSSSSKGSNESKLSKVGLKRGRRDGDLIDDDVDLAQAIALSLAESVENENGRTKIQNKPLQIRKSNSTSKEDPSHKKTTKNPKKSRIQLSEDQVIAFFFSFDEVGKGYITAYDVEKMAVAHDFIWTDGEITKMVRSFDSDGDRKLSLEDFRSIASRCHMLQEPE